MSTQSEFETNAAKGPFEVAYLEALRAVIGVREAEACGRLNIVRSLLTNLSGQQERPVAEAMKATLRDGALNALYGDYKYNEPDHITGAVREPSVWIKDAKILGMIRDHVATLGTKDDVSAYEIFSARTAQTFHTPVMAFKVA